MDYLKNKGVQTTFHYLPLHSSKYYEDKHDGRELPNCDRYADTLVRLPLFYEETDDEAALVARLVLNRTHCL
jgi:dTDP-4-amino-4,6-dideoxygalactose transaminase